MLKGLNEFFDRAFGTGGQPSEQPESRQHAVRVATALLLIEVARADFSADLVEDQKSRELLMGFFELTEDEANMLVEEARTLADASATLQSFTRKLHDRLSVDEKHGIIRMLWEVAMADDHLDKYEDHLIRKIADLLYISHSDVIRIRNRVVESASE